MPNFRQNRVVLWGTYDTGKPRVRILRETLRAMGHEVIECHANPWHGIEDKSQVKALRWVTLLGKALLAYPGLVYRYLRLPPHATVIVSYPGLLDVFVLRAFAWMRARLVWDWFISAYDTIVLDRKLLPSTHPAAKLIKALEWLAARTADGVFMDTREHARRMEEIFHLPPAAVGHVFVGAEPQHFTPAPTTVDRAASPATVVFYGQFIPLHGVQTIIDAARLLQDQPIDWVLVGEGQDAARIDHQLENQPLPRLERIRWVDYATLHQLLRRATVALGIFGGSDKAASVIPNKVFQILSVGCPLITRQSPAMDELHHTTPPMVQKIPPCDAQALAAAVLAVVQSPPAHQPDPRLIQQFDTLALAAQLRTVLAPHQRKAP